MKTELFQSDNKIPPVYVSPSGTKSNCILTSDLRTVDRNQFLIRTGADGIRYFEIQVDLVVSIQSGVVMKFSLEVDGEEMGTVNVKY